MRISKPNTKMGSIDFLLFATIMLLVAIGVVMVYSASSYKAFFDKSTRDSMFYLKRQGLWAIIGTFLMFFTVKFDYKRIKKYTKLLMIVSVIFLLAVFAFESRKGAQRWITLGSVGFQPSEIAKYIVVLYMAKSIELKGGRKIENHAVWCASISFGFCILCRTCICRKEFKYSSCNNDSYPHNFICIGS